jgi:CTD kinase subunit alpha
LVELEGDWHEFESKALRKENERKDKEARRQAKEAALKPETDKKRPSDSEAIDPREAKRAHTEWVPPNPATKAGGGEEKSAPAA